MLATILLVLVLAPAASAYTAVLRPNADMTSTGWSIVGSANAWSALDDPVTEAEEPSGSDYITTSSTTGYRRVALSTTLIGGAAISNPTVWWYTPTAAAVQVQVYGTLGGPIAKGVASGSGWHSMSLSLTGAQSELDALYLDFRPSGAAATRSVSAAFVSLSLEPRVYWGSWIDGDVYSPPLVDAPWGQQTWNEFEDHADKPVSILHFGQPAPWNQAFDQEPFELIRARGALPLLDLESEGVTLAEIAAGAKDASISNWAAAAKSYGRPFFLRWDWEMNGKWFQWGSEAAANPSEYVSAWRRFHDLVEAQGASNITWVWCPNEIFPGSTPLSQLYPGSAYVDWTCIDGYNFGTNKINPGVWRSFSSIFGPTYEALLGLAPGKPIMIGETASTEVGGSKASWISDALLTQLPVNFPNIKAVVWFNQRQLVGSERWDWQIESSTSAQATFASGINSPYFAPNSFENMPLLTPIPPLP